MWWELRNRRLSLLMPQVRSLIIILQILLNVPRKEWILSMQILMFGIGMLLFVVFPYYRLLGNLLLIGKHSQVVRISAVLLSERMNSGYVS